MAKEIICLDRQSLRAYHTVESDTSADLSMLKKSGIYIEMYFTRPSSAETEALNCRCLLELVELENDGSSVRALVCTRMNLWYQFVINKKSQSMNICDVHEKSMRILCFRNAKKIPEICYAILLKEVFHVRSRLHWV